MAVIVRFRAGGSEYGAAVEHVREVRDAAGIVAMPSPGAAVEGLLRRDDDALPVVSALGRGQDHVLILEAHARPFGLLVEHVSGIREIDDSTVGPAPEGQRGELVSGIIREPDGLVMLVDVGAVARTLGRC